MVCDAQRPGTFPRTYNHWHNLFGYKFELVQVPQIGQSIALEQAIFEMEYFWGAKYPKIELLKHLFFKWSGLWIRSKREEEFPTCGELVMHVMKKLGIYQGDYAYMFNPAQVHSWAVENRNRYGK